MNRLAIAVLLLPLAAGCDRIQERLGMPDPAKVAAEGQAIGSACRHAGRGLEDCYRLNPGASKAAVYDGWKEMNEYMRKNNMEAVSPEIPAEAEQTEARKPRVRKPLRERIADEGLLKENLARDSARLKDDKDAEKTDKAKTPPSK